LVFLKEINTLNSNNERSHYVFVLEDDNKIVGCGTIIVELKLLHGFSKVCHIEDVVIDNTIRGKGYGKYLIDYMVNFAKNLNLVYKIILNCSDDKIGFYEKCGFIKKSNQMAIYF
jgi:glucosamine-phosphate N-acetyltransferase